MQHLDEGTIHSWLDGELGSDEAARVEAHVQECPECAVAVAEARGFIAASSRILTALDNAPRGVIPVAAPKKRIDPLIWRVAATVMVVAAGTLVVVRNVGNNSPEQFTLIEEPDTAPILKPLPPIVSQANPAGTSSENSPPKVGTSEPSATRATTSRAPSIALSKRVDLDQRANSNTLERRAVDGRAVGSIGQQDAAGYGGAAAPSARRAPQVAPLAVGPAMDAAEPERLKVVGTPRAVGVKITLYEVTPGDTVTLTEPIATYLATSATGAALATPMRGAREKAVAPIAAARTEAAAAAADAQNARAAQSTAPTQTPSAPPPVRQAEVANGVTTISWTDATTGNVLKLSGRMPEARLQQVRVRIERERAAAAKKIP